MNACDRATSQLVEISAECRGIGFVLQKTRTTTGALPIAEPGRPRYRPHVSEQAPGRDGAEPADQRGPGQLFRRPGHRSVVQHRIGEHPLLQHIENGHPGKNENHLSPAMVFCS